MTRYLEQQPIAFVGEKQGALSYHVRRWLAENDRTHTAAYAPGYNGEYRPNKKGIVNYGNGH